MLSNLFHSVHVAEFKSTTLLTPNCGKPGTSQACYLSSHQNVLAILSKFLELIFIIFYML